MARQTLRDGCCTTPAAMRYWVAAFLLLFGAALLLRTAWPPAAPYGNTAILASMALACFANYGRHRSFHCGLTGPLFAVGTVAAALVESGAVTMRMSAIWVVMIIGAVAAFIAEYRLLRFGGRS